MRRRGHGHIVARPGDVLRIALPLICYFALLFGGAFWLARRAGCAYRETASAAFTAGNNSELAIAVAVGTFGLASSEALATVVALMLVAHALEPRTAGWVRVFALACAASSPYGWLAGVWPFGVVEAVWAGVALRCWRRRVGAAA